MDFASFEVVSVKVLNCTKDIFPSSGLWQRQEKHETGCITWSVFCKPQHRKNVITWPEFFIRGPKPTVPEASRKKALVHGRLRIGVGRIRMFPFLPIPFTTPSLIIQWKLGCRSRKQKRKNQPIAKSGIEHCHWFILPLLLATPTMQFSLDRKQRRHKQNQFSASDSVGWIFTRSGRSTLLITTPSLVKTSL